MNKLDELTKQAKDLEEAIREKTLLIGEADSPKESRYPSERFELENSIELMRFQLKSIKEEIQRISPKS